MSKPTMLNIGCGATHHPDWTNLDVSSLDPAVLPVDISDGLPFPSGSATVCYSSHLLEHLDKDEARYFLHECKRVLGSRGTVRLAVPDLEHIAREYLRLLNVVAAGNSAREADYDWIMLEMYDQTVRNRSGGEMASFLKDLSKDDRSFVRSRIGAEAEHIWEMQTVSKPPLLSTLRSFHMRLVGWVVLLLAGKSARKGFQTGLFRSRGEIHQWMYDRFSLKRLLEQAGFVDIKTCTPTESRIPEFERYSLDALNGIARKPDSIYIEASKP